MVNIDLYKEAVSTYEAIARVADKFIKQGVNTLFWKRQKREALSNAAYFRKKFIDKRPINYKDINVGFILINKDRMNIEQMAAELSCSPHKIRTTIKEFKIEYKPKIPNNLKHKKQ